MKHYLLGCLLIIVCSCQKEELTIVQGNQETSFLADAQLTRLMQSVASHDGSFDDIVDQSHCFSINFPYEILLNGKTHIIQSVDDLLAIDASDTVEPVFPLTITYANYIETEVVTPKIFENNIVQCLNGFLYDEVINCVDFSYPVSISLYYQDNSEYETVVFSNDKETFLGIDLFESGTLATINYPIQVQMIDGSQIDIESNDELKLRILQMIPVCE